MVKKKKKPGYSSSFTVKDDQGNRFGEVGEQTGTKSPPSPLHPFSLRKSKGRVIARLIPQDKSLSDSRNPRQLDREIRFYPFYFPVCFGERGERGRLISRIENEKKGKEEGDFGKKKRNPNLCSILLKRNRHGIWCTWMWKKMFLFFQKDFFFLNVDFR